MLHNNPFRTVGDATAVLSRAVATKPLVLGGLTGHNNGASDLYIQVFDIIQATRTCGITQGSATVSTTTSTTGLRAGMAVDGIGIATGTTIASVDGANQITLSAAATVTAASTTLLFRTTTPAAGDVPLYSVLAFKGLPYSFALPVGVDLSACTVVASTTLASYTAATGTPVTIQAQIQGGSI